MARARSGQKICMEPDRRGASTRDVEREMEDEAGRMQRRLDELGEHVEQAAKKAEQTSERTGLAGDEALDTVAADAQQRTTSSDDPVSAVGNPAEAEED